MATGLRLEALRPRSLSLRLIVSAGLWSAIALLIAGFILTSLYRQTVENAFDERLDVYLKTLIGALASQRSANLSDPGNLGEQRFEQIYSGWYWQARQGISGPVILTSRSLFTDILDIGDPVDAGDGVVHAEINGPDGQFLRVLQRTISFDNDDPHTPQPTFTVMVAGNASELREEIATFRYSVFLTLAVFGLGLVVAILMQIRWGLRPLDQVRRGLANLRSGLDHRFEGPFPAEIEPMAQELNALIKSNQEIIERARTQVGNLAHALKTPLSVIANEARAAGGPFADKVNEQSEIMRAQIAHYLDRARIAASADVIGTVTEVAPVLARLARAMNRIHSDRGIAVDLRVPEAARFRGEQQDLEEIAGNLLDNACKWAKTRVEVSVTYHPPQQPDASGRLGLAIDDDGPGLSAEECAEATRRGKRLDETKPGSGLGLSIVTDLVALYRGRLALGRSRLGGLRADVELPGA